MRCRIDVPLCHLFLIGLPVAAHLLTLVNNGATLDESFCLCDRSDRNHSSTNTRHRTCAGLMLGHRRRRWSNIRPAQVQCLVINGHRHHVIYAIYYTLISNNRDRVSGDNKSNSSLIRRALKTQGLFDW